MLLVHDNLWHFYMKCNFQAKWEGVINSLSCLFCGDWQKQSLFETFNTIHWKNFTLNYVAEKFWQ